MLRLILCFLLPIAVLADPIAQILQYATDTGDVAGAERLCDFYAENLPADSQLYKALSERLADGTWQALDATARKKTELFGFTAPPKATISLEETFARAVVEGISPANLKARSELAAQYADLLRDSDLFPWMVRRLNLIREQENKRVSLLKRGNMLIQDANKQMTQMNSGNVPENRYQKLKELQRTTGSSKAREEALRDALEAERNKGLALVNESYDYPEAAKALQTFIKETAAKVREAQ